MGFNPFFDSFKGLGLGDFEGGPPFDFKVNVLSEQEEEYYYENNSSSSETDKSQTNSEKELEKIENCLCQVNMITADQKLII